MARLDTVNIDMLEIHQKVKDTGDPDTNISLNDTDIRGMAAPDATYAGNDGISTGNNSTIAIGEFRNGEHTSLGSFPSLNNWTTFQTRSVTATGYYTAEAFAFITFRNLTASNRIEVGYVAGTNQTMATVYTDYIDYSGFTGDIKVKWTAPIFFPNGSFIANPYALAGPIWAYPQANSSGNLSPAYIRNTDYTIPTNGGYLQMKFFAATNASGSTNQTSYMFCRDFQTQVSFVSDGATYSALSAQKDIYLTARRGLIF